MIGVWCNPRGHTAGPGLMGYRTGVPVIFCSDGTHLHEGHFVGANFKAAWDSAGDMGLGLGDVT